jgi:hypothetical protein
MGFNSFSVSFLAKRAEGGLDCHRRKRAVVLSGHSGGPCPSLIIVGRAEPECNGRTSLPGDAGVQFPRHWIPVSGTDGLVLPADLGFDSPMVVATAAGTVGGTLLSGPLASSIRLALRKIHGWKAGSRLVAIWKRVGTASRGALSCRLVD